MHKFQSVARIIYCTAAKEAVLCHEALVAAHIHIEELHVKACLFFDCPGNITTGID